MPVPTTTTLRNLVPRPVVWGGLLVLLSLSAWQPPAGAAARQAAAAPTPFGQGEPADEDEGPGAAADAAASLGEAPARPGAAGQVDMTLPESGPEPQYETGVVTGVAPGALPAEQRVSIRLSSGARAGEVIQAEQPMSGQADLDMNVKPGDEVVVAGLPDPKDPNAPLQYQLADFQRAHQLGWFVGLTVLLLAVVGGWRGLTTLGVLAITGLVIVGGLIPLTLAGYSPLPLAVVFAAVIALATTLLTSGPGRKSWAAIGGTTGAVAVATALASWAAHFTSLNGLSSEVAGGALALSHGQIDFAGLLAAGMVLGALGVMLDLALSISASVDELGEANPGLGRGVLLQAGLQVGRDLLSTASNTLLLAYLGSFLPMLLALGAGHAMGPRLLHQEAVVGEAVTFGIGLLGLLTVVPLTAALASWRPSQRAQS